MPISNTRKKPRNKEPKPFSVKDGPHLAGGHMKKALALQTEVIGLRECVFLSASSSWINDAIWGRQRSPHNKIIADFTCETLKKFGVDHESPGSNTVPSTFAAQVEPHHALEKSMSFDSDSTPVSDRSSTSSDDPPPPTQSRHGQRAEHRQQVTDWMSVTIDDCEFMALPSPKRKAIYIAKDESGKHPWEPFTNVLAMLQQKVQAGDVAKKPKRVSQTSEEDDRSRVNFLFSKQAWQLTWKDDNGHVHREYVDYRVPQMDATIGRPFPPKEREKIKDRVKADAREAWNKKDKSDAPRY